MKTKDDALRAMEDLLLYAGHPDEDVRRAQVDRFMQSLAQISLEDLEQVVIHLGLRTRAVKPARLAMLFAVRKHLEARLKSKEVPPYDGGK